MRRAEVDVAVVGGGSAGLAAAAAATAAGRTVLVLDAAAGDEVVGIYAGPMIIVRTPTGMLHVHAHEIVVATGAAEIHPVCPGNELAGLVTVRAAEALQAAGLDLGTAVAVGTPPAGVAATPVAGRLVRFEGEGGRVRSVVTVDSLGGAETAPADTVILGLGHAPRDVLARMAGEVPGPPGRQRGRRGDAPAAADRGCRLSLLRHDRRRSRGRLGPGLHRARAAQAGEPRLSRHLPGRRLPAPRPLMDRRPDRGGPRPVHRPAGVAPDHPRRGRGGHRGRRVPADPAPRRAPGPRRADGSLRWLVAAVALRRRDRRVLGGSRGRLDRRRQHARQAPRLRPGRRRAPRAALPVHTSRTSGPAGPAMRCCSTSAAT